jgi:hypothetical protein
MSCFLLGDSKVIIDWINGKVDLQAAALECWKERTLEATRLVKSLSISHIYREDNRDTDILSKQAFSLPLGLLRYSRWEDGNEGPPITVESLKRSSTRK